MCGVRTTFSSARSSSLTQARARRRRAPRQRASPRERRDERGLVDDRPAGGVDEDGSRLHRGERVGVDEMPRLGVSGQCRLTTSAARALAQIVVASREDCVGAVRARELGDPAADPPRPDDEDSSLPSSPSPTMKSGPHSHVVAAPERAVALDDAPQEGECEPDRVLGRSVREHARRVRDDDPALANRREVDVVEAHCVVRDDAELRAGGVEKRRVDGRSPASRRLRPHGLALSTSSNDAASSRAISAGTPAASWTLGRGTASRRGRAGRATTSRRPCAGSGRSRRGRRRCRPTRCAGPRCPCRRRPLADDEPVPHVQPAAGEARSGFRSKMRAMCGPTSSPSTRSPAVWFSNTIPGAWKVTIASTSWAFQASL